MNKGEVKNFYILDFTRFMAAVAVLFFHYRHFYYENGVKPIAFSADTQPMYSSFPFLYDYGFYAVQYFWILSGFVFHYTYMQRFKDGQVSASSYFINRVARLYPLHFLMLIIVAVLAHKHFEQYGYYFVYHSNDIKHFILNLFMLSNWGFEVAESFNGPIWSVSVEIFSYIVFFLVATYFKIYSYLGVSIILLISIFLFKLTGLNLFYGLFCFYLGAMVYLLYISILKQLELRVFGLRIVPVLIFSGMLTLAVTLTVVTSKNIFILSLLGLFSLSILGLSLVQYSRVGAFSTVKTLGDISYSIYLIHFPIQLILVLYFKEYVVVESPWFLIGFILSTVLLSYFTFKFYELPLKNKTKDVLTGAACRASIMGKV